MTGRDPHAATPQPPGMRHRVFFTALMLILPGVILFQLFVYSR